MAGKESTCNAEDPGDVGAVPGGGRFPGGGHGNPLFLRIPGMGEPGALRSMGSHIVRLKRLIQLHFTGEVKSISQSNRYRV